MSIDRFVTSATHNRMLRFLLAAKGGVVREYLTPEEQRATAELEQLDILHRDAEGKLVVNASHPDLPLIVGRILPPTPLTAADRELDDLLLFIQQLPGVLLMKESIADLIGSGFRKLSDPVPFDIGAAAMAEPTLDVYLSKRPNYEKAVNDPLIDHLRELLRVDLPFSSSTDTVIRGDFSDLPQTDSTGNPLTNHIHTVLRQNDRASGIIALYRTEGTFSLQEQRMLEILAGQIAIGLSNLSTQQEIRSLADTDDLTGIANRRYFRRQLTFEVERSKTYNLPLSLLLYDIDDFKMINDRYGHTTGDVVLSELCGTVRETLRLPDIFARFGGDEFVVILPHTDLPGAVRVAERMLERVEDIRIPTGENDQTICPSISIGVAAFVGPDMSANDLLKMADEKLYLSKRNGKGRFSF
jgi:diguanylate cyclase (GGDEF) domain